MLHVNYSKQESNKQTFFFWFFFAVYGFDTPVTLRKGHGQQTWYELVDPN